MTRYVDGGDGGPGNPGGGGGSLPTTYARLTPAAQTISSSGPVTLVPDFAGGTGTLTPGGIPCTTGVPVTVTPVGTTTYTLTVGSVTATATVTVGGIPSAVTRYLDVNWTYTEPIPVGSCMGFELVVYLGSNPDDSGSWIKPIIPLLATDRRWVGAFSLVPPKTLNCAIRSVYSAGKSTWSVVAAGVPFT